MQMWLYGTQGGSHWPKCEIYRSNYATRQQYNRTLKLTTDHAGAARAGMRRVRQASSTGAPSPVPAEQSLQVMTILDGIYRSQAAGKEVVLD